MKFSELQEARLAGSGMIGVLTDDTTDGDAAWGSYGINLEPGQSLEKQVANWLIKDFFGEPGGLEDFKHELEEHLTSEQPVLPTAVWIVPADLYNIVHAASQQTDPGGDSAWYAMHQLIKTIYLNAAKETLQLDWKKFK